MPGVLRVFVVEPRSSRPPSGFHSPGSSDKTRGGGCRPFVVQPSCPASRPTKVPYSLVPSGCDPRASTTRPGQRQRAGSDESRFPMVRERSEGAIGGQRRAPLRSRPAICTFGAKDSRVENARLRRNGPAKVCPCGNKVSPHGHRSAARNR